MTDSNDHKEGVLERALRAGIDWQESPLWQAAKAMENSSMWQAAKAMENNPFVKLAKEQKKQERLLSLEEQEKKRFENSGIKKELDVIGSMNKINQKRRAEEDELRKLQLENARLENERLKNTLTAQESKVNHPNKSKQQQREAVLSEVIAELKTENPNIDGVYSRSEIWGKCLKKSQQLFSVGEDAQNKFFNAQKLIKPKEAGRPIII